MGEADDDRESLLKLPIRIHFSKYKKIDYIVDIGKCMYLNPRSTWEQLMNYVETDISPFDFYFDMANDKYLCYHDNLESFFEIDINLQLFQILKFHEYKMGVKGKFKINDMIEISSTQIKSSLKSLATPFVISDVHNPPIVVQLTKVDESMENIIFTAKYKIKLGKIRYAEEGYPSNLKQLHDYLPPLAIDDILPFDNTMHGLKYIFIDEVSQKMFAIDNQLIHFSILYYDKTSHKISTGSMFLIEEMEQIDQVEGGGIKKNYKRPILRCRRSYKYKITRKHKKKHTSSKTKHRGCK